MSSRADVSAPITTSDLKVFYCACGELGLVINRSLASLARRPVDNAMILRNTGKDKMYYKLNALLDREPIVYKRPDGLEKQWRLRCQRCDLQLGYETSDAREASTRGPYTYLLHGSVTETQNAVPIAIANDLHRSIGGEYYNKSKR